MKTCLTAAFAALLCLPVALFAGECAVQFTAGTVDAGTVSTNAPHLLSARLMNSSNDTVFIRDIKIAQTTEVFTPDNIQTGALPPKSQRDFTFRAFSRHNLSYTAVAFTRLRCAAGEYSLPITLTAQFTYTDSTFNFTQNLTGSALISALSTYLQPQTVFSYSEARKQMWGKVDNIGGEVECVYTGRKVKTTGIPDASTFNTEHTWPQSKGSDTGPANSDLFHLYPTFATANSVRSNNPYGIVASNIYWQENGSKAGYPAGRNDSIFEPRDVHKGNVARSMFYYCTRYGNRKGTFDKEGFLTSQEDILRVWNTTDTVDERERARNQAIYILQTRRNPYIDHPEFIERVNRLSGQQDFPPYPRLAASDEHIILSFYNSTAQTQELPVYVANTGTETAVITAADATLNPDAVFEILDITPKELPSGGWARIKIRAKHPAASKVEGTIRIRFADGLPSIPLAVTATTEQALAVDELPQQQQQFVRILGCTPNPVSEEAMVSFVIPEQLTHNARITLHAQDGRMIADASAQTQWRGDYGTLILRRSELPTGAIVIRLRAGEFSDARIIIAE